MEDRLKNHQKELVRFCKLLNEGKYPTHPNPTGITFITDEGLETFSHELLCEFVTRKTYQTIAKEIEFRLRGKGLLLELLLLQ